MTDITELAQSNELLIANGNETANLLRHLANNEIDSDYFAVVSECESYGKETDAELSITEFAHRAAGYVDALVEALEKAQQKIIELQQGCENDPRVHEIIDLKERIAELENYAEAEAVGADKAAEDSVYWMKRCKELESRTVTDWIEHDGKWRPDSLSTDELVYLKTRKQELKIPYPAGKVLGWMHTGGDMDVMAYKLASPQARTVTVKLPQRYSMLFREGFSEDYRTEIAYSAEDIQEMLTAAGIKWEAE
ncbi:TPA: hypothetical protein ACIJVK_002604 [Klebsiella aerogenes]